MRIPGLTLGRSLSLGLASATLVAALLAGVLLDRWGDSLLESSEKLREAASRRAAAVVQRALGGAEASLASLQAQARGGVFDADDAREVERALFTEILANRDLAEVTFTRANETDSGPTWLSRAPGARRCPSSTKKAIRRRSSPRTPTPRFAGSSWTNAHGPRARWS